MKRIVIALSLTLWACSSQTSSQSPQKENSPPPKKTVEQSIIGKWGLRKPIMMMDKIPILSKYDLEFTKKKCYLFSEGLYALQTHKAYDYSVDGNRITIQDENNSFFTFTDSSLKWETSAFAEGIEIQLYKKQ